MSEYQELRAIEARYARRAAQRGLQDRYSPLRPEVNRLLQERQRALVRWLAARYPGGVADLRLLEVGCGAGGNLLELLQLGFAPEHLAGAELLPERLTLARQRLPATLILHAGDACVLPQDPGSLDLVLTSTVFSSILDTGLQQRLAQAIWGWLKPGGALICYDFVVDNPRNPDVRGLRLRRLRELFPDAELRSQRVTLAPPLARALCRVHPALYGVANAVHWLRTHRLSFLVKPEISA